MKQKRKPYHKWTQEEVEWLEANYLNKSMKQLCRKLGLGKGQVMNKAMKLGLTKCGKISKKRKEIEMYLINKTHIKDEDIARMFNVTPHHITSVRSRIQAGRYIDEFVDFLILAEVKRLTGWQYKKMYKMQEKGLVIEKNGYYRLVNIKNLLDVMKENPSTWDATKCDKEYFQEFDWFNEKRKTDFDKMVKKRWGKFIA